MTSHRLGSYRFADIAKVLAEHMPWSHPLGDPAEHAAVAMILRETRSGPVETLFIRRVEHPNDPWSGHMAFPGGRMDPDDGAIESVARRETFEEIGIEMDDKLLIGRMDDIDGARGRPVTLWVTPFVYRCPVQAELELGLEVADSVWIPLTYLADPSNVRPYFLPAGPPDYGFPSFQYGHYTVWGLTYRILADFMNLFGIEMPREPMTDTNQRRG